MAGDRVNSGVVSVTNPTDQQKKRSTDHRDDIYGDKGGGPYDEVNLKRTLGLFSGSSFIIGVMIGSGIFISPKGVARGSGSVGFSLITWTICGVISIIGALCYAELGTVIPESGGDHSYLYLSYGRMLAYLYDWSNIVLSLPSSLSTVAQTCAEYVMVPLYDDGCGRPPESHIKMLAILVILLLMAVNAYSVRVASRIQVIFTAAKVLSLVLIIVGGIVYMIQGNTQNFSSVFDGTETDIGKISLGIYNGMWAYEGWKVLNFVTEELKNPARNLPLAIFMAVPFVMVVYLLTNISYFSVMTVQGILDSPAVGVTWITAVIPSVAWIIPLSVAMSTFGSANGSLFGSGRLTFAASRAGLIPGFLANISVKRFTPLPALLLTSVIAVIYTIAGGVTSLISYMNVTQWTFNSISISTIFYFRWKKKDAYRPFKVPLVLAVIMQIASLFLVIVPILMQPQIEFLYAFLVLFGGLFLYFPFVYKGWNIPGFNKISMVIQLALVTCPPHSLNTSTEKKDSK